MTRLTNFLSPFIALLVIFCIWEYLVYILSVPLYILPAPSNIFLSLNANFYELILATLNTLKITFLAFLIATFTAIFLAILFSLSKILEKSLYPITVIFQVTPVVAIAPLILIWVGLPDFITNFIYYKILPKKPNETIKEKSQNKTRSRHISQSVKDKVWNRDGGQCVECGSNENLEFDHIIPHSKGGANTYRNIK